MSAEKDKPKKPKKPKGAKLTSDAAMAYSWMSTLTVSRSVLR